MSTLRDDGFNKIQQGLTTLEEVLHLVTDLGWDEAFPDIWGERKGSSVANAMDLARGGYFENVPAPEEVDGVSSVEWVSDLSGSQSFNSSETDEMVAKITLQ